MSSVAYTLTGGFVLFAVWTCGCISPEFITLHQTIAFFFSGGGRGGSTARRTCAHLPFYCAYLPTIFFG